MPRISTARQRHNGWADCGEANGPAPGSSRRGRGRSRASLAEEERERERRRRAVAADERAAEVAGVAERDLVRGLAERNDRLEGEVGGVARLVHDGLGHRRVAPLTSPIFVEAGLEYPVVVPSVPAGRYRFFSLPRLAYDMRGEIEVRQ